MVAENWGSAGRAFIELWAARALLFAMADSRSSSAELTSGECVTLKRAERCLCNIRAHNKGSAHRLRSPFSKRNSSSWKKKRIRRTYIFKLDFMKTKIAGHWQWRQWVLPGNCYAVFWVIFSYLICSRVFWGISRVLISECLVAYFNRQVI